MQPETLTSSTREWYGRARDYAAARGQSLLDEITRDCTDWVLDENWEATGVPDKTLARWRERIAEAILAIHEELD